MTHADAIKLQTMEAADRLAEMRIRVYLAGIREGMQQKDIARSLGISESRLSQILKRARKRGLLPPDTRLD